ncbi:hypothetical protein [Ideonella sp. A 288]|uniref:hypothetical protein n=1 Tax=Ideonella sp. A 288 TaxID=1962181 RepID=UPI0011849A5B|nr:hypothetical protein [Ideonella sp. A 288]
MPVSDNADPKGSAPANPGRRHWLEAAAVGGGAVALPPLAWLAGGAGGAAAATPPVATAGPTGTAATPLALLAEERIDESAQGLTSEYLYANWYRWRHPRGDWVDAAGKPQGYQAFGASVASAQGLLRIDITRAVQAGQPLQLVLRTSSPDGGALVASRNAPDVTRRPFLAITPSGGKPLLLDVSADAEANGSTVTARGAEPAMKVSADTHAFLAFPPVDIKPASAMLVLHVEQLIGQGGRLEVYRMASPRLPDDPSRVSLESDPRVFFRSAAFEEPLFEGIFNTRGSNNFEQRRVVDTDRGRALELSFDPRTSLVLDASVAFVPEATEAAFEYDLKVLPGFTPSDGGKMPGWSSRTKPDDKIALSRNKAFAGWPPGSMGTLLAGKGGDRVNGHDGWSLRGGYIVPWAAKHPLHGQMGLTTYAYHAAMQDQFGDSWPWTQWGPSSAVVGQWQRIHQRLRVNTPGKRNGLLEARIDGRLVFRKTDVYLRDGQRWDLNDLGVATEGGIGRVWLNVYHGGTALPPTRCAAMLLRNLKVARLA